jgi:ComF family protein
MSAPLAILKKVSDELLNRPCILCGQASLGPTDICEPCQNDLPWYQSGCLRCGLSLPNNATQCGYCLTQKLYFDRCLCAFNYQFPINKLILSFKNNEKLIYGKVLAHLFADRLKRHPSLPDRLIPVPIHWITQRLRGFNQSDLISTDLGSLLAIPVVNRACKRTRQTQQQKSLNSVARRKNVGNAFAANIRLDHLHIGVVDDVVTSMATTNSLSRELKKAGAAKITILCLARAPLP